MRTIALALALASVACGPAFTVAVADQGDERDAESAALDAAPFARLAPPDASADTGALTPTDDAGEAKEADSGSLMAPPDSSPPVTDSSASATVDAGESDPYPGVHCIIFASAGNSACLSHGSSPAWTCSPVDPLRTNLALPDPETPGAAKPADLPAACWATYVDSNGSFFYCC